MRHQKKRSRGAWCPALGPAVTSLQKTCVWFWQRRANRHTHIHTHPYSTLLAQWPGTVEPVENKMPVVYLEFGKQWRPWRKWPEARSGVRCCIVDRQGVRKRRKRLSYGWCSVAGKMSMVACGVTQPWLEVWLCSSLAYCSICFHQLFRLQSGDDACHRELLRGLRKAIHAKYLACLAQS